MWTTQAIQLRGWRQRWADQENERRQRAYEAAVKTWHQWDDKLRRLKAAAAEFKGSAQAAAGIPLQLFPGEAVYTVLPNAELVEAEGRHIAGLPRPERAVLPVPDLVLDPVLPHGVGLIDAGTAVVTDRAVIFLGRDGVREWTYTRLSGIAHDRATSVTLMHAVDEKGICGLLLPPATVDRFRFHVTLAFADTIGGRTAIVAQLNEMIAVHQRSRHTPPATVTPGQAPLTALVTTRNLASGTGKSGFSSTSRPTRPGLLRRASD